MAEVVVEREVRGIVKVMSLVEGMVWVKGWVVIGEVVIGMVKVDDLLMVIFKGCFMGGFWIGGVWVGFWTATKGGSSYDVWPFSPLILGIPKISLAALIASSKVALNEAPTDSSGALGKDDIWFTAKRDLGIPKNQPKSI